MPKKKKRSRKELVEKIKGLLQKRGAPKRQMSFIVLSTAAAGFLYSFLMLSLGLRSMSIRYVLAISMAYLTFLFLIRVWLRFHKKELEKDGDIDPLDIVDIADSIPAGGPGNTDFPGSESYTGGRGGGGGGGMAFDPGVDELTVVIAILAALLAGLIASLYIVFASPSLFAEVLLDGALSMGLYSRLKKLERRHWLQSAIKKTIVPFLIVLIFFFIAGIIMQNYAPGADSIGDVLEKLMHKPEMMKL